jgi:hypothetical protein
MWHSKPQDPNLDSKLLELLDPDPVDYEYRCSTLGVGANLMDTPLHTIVNNLPT